MNLHAKFAMAAILFAAAGAQAQIVPVLNSATQQPAGDYLYDYSTYVEAGDTVNPNSYFTIYDIYGFQSVYSMPTGWIDNVQATGVTPAGTSPADSNSVPNITWTYTSGPSISGDPGVGYTYLGEFEFLGTQGNYTQPSVGEYTYSDLETDNGEQQQGISTVSVPLAPEPAAMSLVGVAAMLSLRRRR
jgi:hypothetical protein